MGHGADLLSHEATFTADMRDKAHIAQHSTAPMAGAFARALAAQTLVLTHFSGRFLDWKGKARPSILPPLLPLQDVRNPSEDIIARPQVPDASQDIPWMKLKMILSAG